MGSYDVLVVGCGPVGAVLAARLGALGMQTLVVERAAEVHPLPRAVAADDEVQHLLSLVAPGLLDGSLHDVPVRLVDAARQPLGDCGCRPGRRGTAAWRCSTSRRWSTGCAGTSPACRR